MALEAGRVQTGTQGLSRPVEVFWEQLGHALRPGGSLALYRYGNPVPGICVLEWRIPQAASGANTRFGPGDLPTHEGGLSLLRGVLDIWPPTTWQAGQKFSRS